MMKRSTTPSIAIPSACGSAPSASKASGSRCVKDMVRRKPLAAASITSPKRAKGRVTSQKAHKMAAPRVRKLARNTSRQRRTLMVSDKKIEK